MKLSVEGGTVLVDGPASVLVVEGKAEVFGSSMKIGKKVVIREGKRLPVFIKEKADLEVSLGENAEISEVDGDTIPKSWITAFETLKGMPGKPIVAMVLGKIDSGKSSFCTYLANRLHAEKSKVAILDGDVGQSDIGPPGTVAYVFVARPVTDLFTLKEDNAFFVGATSPSEALDAVVRGNVEMKTEILLQAPDFVIVNTDGWVEGELAVAYKTRLAQELGVNIVFHVQQEAELVPLIAALEKVEKCEVTIPSVVMERRTEKRRSLREMGYAKYLAGGKARSLPFRLITTEELKAAADGLDGEGNQVLGFYGSQRRFLGIGVLCGIDFARKTLKVFTPVSAEPSCIVLGKIRLDRNQKEIPSLL